MPVQTESPEPGVAARRANPVDQNHLESAILAYQHALSTGNSAEIADAYNAVSRIYPPLNFVNKWYRKYRHLYDTREDFIQEYLIKFCEVLAKWKPRDIRPQSKFGGSGNFMNYYWSALQKHYSNLVKRAAAGRRNTSCMCPICETWCISLSTHLRKSHEELLWDQMDAFGMPVEMLTRCPFCTSHKVPRTAPCSHQPRGACDDCLQTYGNQKLREHLLSAHSGLLFERFRDIYPNHITLSSRPASVYMFDDDGDDDFNLYDVVPDTGHLQSLLASTLTPVQKSILQRVIFQRATQVSYDADLYNCSPEEFAIEFENLNAAINDQALSVACEFPSCRLKSR